MSQYSGNGERCPGCGTTYGQTRTGLSYRDVWLMLWHATEFRYKRRGTVLGLWHSIKKSEVYPREADLVDCANMYHLWVLPEGHVLNFGLHLRDARRR